MCKPHCQLRPFNTGLPLSAFCAAGFDLFKVWSPSEQFNSRVHQTHTQNLSCDWNARRHARLK
eukprot:6319333-Amphidinium_carterae.1